MDRNDFLANFAEQFEDTDPNEIQFETKFHELEEWMLIAMAKVSYSKVISGDELKKCVTVEDVYNLMNNK